MTMLKKQKLYKFLKSLWWKKTTDHIPIRNFEMTLTEVTPQSYKLEVQDNIYNLGCSLTFKTVEVSSVLNKLFNISNNALCLICDSFTEKSHKNGFLYYANRELGELLCKFFILKLFFELFKFCPNKSFLKVIVLILTEEEIKALNPPSVLIKQESEIMTSRGKKTALLLYPDQEGCDILFDLMAHTEGEINKHLLQLREISF